MTSPRKIRKSREFQRALGLSDDEFYCTDFSQEPITERNYKPKPTLEKFSGESMGKVVYNPKTEELDIVINNPKD
jgi:hypothetical protein